MIFTLSVQTSLQCSCCRCIAYIRVSRISTGVKIVHCMLQCVWCAMDTFCFYFLFTNVTPIIWNSDYYWLVEPSLSCYLGDSWYCVQPSFWTRKPIRNELYDDTLGFREVVLFRMLQKALHRHRVDALMLEERNDTKQSFKAVWFAFYTVWNRHRGHLR